MVLGRDAVAGQGAYISLLLPPAARENPALHFGFPLTAYIRTGRFRSCFIQLLRIQFGKIRLSCCHWKVSVRPQTQPLSSASGSKRYNTLDFPQKVVCQQGCSRPYWKPRAKGATLLWTPLALSLCRYVPVLICIMHSLLKRKSRILHLTSDEICGIFCSP